MLKKDIRSTDIKHLRLGDLEGYYEVVPNRSGKDDVLGNDAAL